MAYTDPLNGDSPLGALAKSGAYQQSHAARSRLTGSPYASRPLPASLTAPRGQQPQPTQQQQQPPPPPAAPTGYDPSADPIVQQIAAAGQRNVADAQLAADAGTKQALISYGYDPALEGLYPDANTRAAAEQNPYSLLANLAHDYGTRTRGLEEQLNKSNLFYSGARARDLAESARGYGQQQATAAGGLQNALTGISGGLLSAKQKAETDRLAALADAYRAYVPPEYTPGTQTTAAPAPIVGPGLATPGLDEDVTPLNRLARTFNRRPA